MKQNPRAFLPWHETRCLDTDCRRKRGRGSDFWNGASTDPHGSNLAICRWRVSGFPNGEVEKGKQTEYIGKSGVEPVIIRRIVVSYIVKLGYYIKKCELITAPHIHVGRRTLFYDGLMELVYIWGFDELAAIFLEGSQPVPDAVGNDEEKEQDIERGILDESLENGEFYW